MAPECCESPEDQRSLGGDTEGGRHREPLSKAERSLSQAMLGPGLLVLQRSPWCTGHRWGRKGCRSGPAAPCR